MRIGVRAVLVAAVLFACGREGSNPVAPSLEPNLAIVDGTNGGRAGFFFLSPIVANPGVVGTFDGTITPRARVCALDTLRTSCASTLVTMLTGTGQGALAVDPTTGAFAGNWTSPSSLEISTTSGKEMRYRLEIELDIRATTVVLGYADIWVVDKQQKLKELPAGYVGLVRGKSLQIRFGVLPATVSRVVVTPNPATVNVSQTQQMTATAYDIHDGVVTGAVFTWSSDASGIAAVSASGLASGVTSGSTNIKATTSGVTGSAPITVIGTPPAPPDAVNDGPVGTSVPGNAFHGEFSATLSSGGSTPGLLANDDRGSPLAMVSSFGGGDLGGTVTSNAAGATATFGTGGSLQVNADGSFSFTPSANFSGQFGFSYRLTNGSGSDDAVVAIKIGTPPSASNDAYPATIIGNVSINTASSSGFSVLSNDSGTGLTINLVSSPDGNTSINADGTFSFNPAPGFTGTATFTYTVQNGFGTSAVATVSVPVTKPIWFVDASAAAGGDGRLGTPFKCLVDAGTACYDDSANEAGDILFIASGSYASSGALVLKNTQTVIGQGASTSIAAITGLTNAADSPVLPATGSSQPPTLSSAGNGVTLGTSNRLYGLRIGSTTGIGLFGNGFGTLLVQDIGFSNTRTGQTLGLTNGSFAAGSTFESIYTQSSPAQGLSLVQVGGSFTVKNGALIQGAGSVGISVQSGTAGTFEFGITRVIGSAGDAIQLENNATALTFSDVYFVPAVNNRGLVASSNTGMIKIASGTIQTAGAAAITINVNGAVTPTPLDMTLTTVSANGGSNGIVMNRTTGFIQIIGNGTPLSAGTIENMTGNGIALNDVALFAIGSMTVRNNAGTAGLFGGGVIGLIVVNSSFSNNGTPNAFGTSIYLLNTSGTADIAATAFSGTSTDHVRYEGTAGTMRLGIGNNTFGSSGQFGTGIFAGGSAVVTATVGSNTFQGSRSAHISMVAGSNATMHAGIGGNTLSCGNATAFACNIQLYAASTAAFSYAISNNVITGAIGNAIDIVKEPTSGAMSGFIRNNSIGTAGVAGSGTLASGIKLTMRPFGTGSGSHQTAIEDNVIRRYKDDGIQILTWSGAAPLDATISGNTIAEGEGLLSKGVFLLAGFAATDAAVSCLAMTANSITGSAGASGVDFYLQQNYLTSVRLPGYLGANNDNTAAVSFVRANQTLATATTPTGTATNNVAGGGGGFIGGAACGYPQ